MGIWIPFVIVALFLLGLAGMWHEVVTVGMVAGAVVMVVRGERQW